MSDSKQSDHDKNSAIKGWLMLVALTSPMWGPLILLIPPLNVISWTGPIVTIVGGPLVFLIFGLRKARKTGVWESD
jgi:hypothetical protein